MFIYFIAIFLVPLLPSNLILWIIYALVGSFFIVYIFFLSSYFHEDELKSRGFGRLRNLFIRLDNLKKSSKEVLLIITPILVLGIFIASFITGFFWSIKGNGIVDVLNLEEKKWLGEKFSKVGEFSRVPLGLLERKDRFVMDSEIKAVWREIIEPQILIPDKSVFGGVGVFDS